MSKTQCYIGAPNGVILCIDRNGPEALAGRLWHGYRQNCMPFGRWIQAIMEMEGLFDRIRFPFPGTSFRSFVENKKTIRYTQEVPRLMSDQELLEKRGDLGTFIVRVQHRQNSSWQGRITWMEEDKTVNFRSIWEMIKLVEQALETAQEQQGEKEIGWEPQGEGD